MDTSALDLDAVVRYMQDDLNAVETRLRQEATVDYPFVGEIIDNLIGSGGKRLRPLILLLSAKPYTYDIDKLIPAAAGVELLHNASLIHDDTVDHADLRRGQPTLNSLVAPETVILLGDYLFARSAMLAAETMNPSVVAVFANTLAEICDGQLSEIFTSRNIDQEYKDYERRIYGKTASLFAGSAEMGAIISEAPDREIQLMKEYGGHVGMAFQIVDDILDLRQSTDEIGKPAGLDLREGTVTLPTMLYFRNGNTASDTEFVKRVISNSGDITDDDYDNAVGLIRQSGALDEALDVAENYVTKARECIAHIDDHDAQSMLEALAIESLSRTS